MNCFDEVMIFLKIVTYFNQLILKLPQHMKLLNHKTI